MIDITVHRVFRLELTPVQDIAAAADCPRHAFCRLRIYTKNDGTFQINLFADTTGELYLEQPESDDLIKALTCSAPGGNPFA